MSDGPVVGVAGDSDETIASAVGAAGGTLERGAPASVAGDCDYLVAVGEPALLAVARTNTDVPVLPVDAGRGVRSVPADDGPAAIERLVTGAFERDSHPVLDVTVADRSPVRALMDVMLVTADAGEISEYGVYADDDPVSQFRADGVVVATPAGSGGYAHRAGGPVVARETDVASVVPVAPFAIDAAHWILPLSSVSLSVERDEAPVHLFVDDCRVGEIAPDERVRLTAGGALTVAVVPESQTAFDA